MRIEPPSRIRRSASTVMTYRALSILMLWGGIAL
jgi:hypothetical protein